MALDKPPGWMLVPFSWQKTTRNLQAAITSSIAGNSFWARSRNLKFLHHVHRLDADTSGILLCAKSPGALETFSDLFEQRKMEKKYLAIAHGIPRKNEWSCQFKIAPNPDEIGKVKINSSQGKEAETHFRVLQSREKISLIEARPITGRTHQIRIHLAEAGHPVVGDALYGSSVGSHLATRNFPLGLRAVSLSYFDPFSKRRTRIFAPTEEFLREYQFSGVKLFT